MSFDTPLTGVDLEPTLPFVMDEHRARLALFAAKKSAPLEPWVAASVFLYLDPWLVSAALKTRSFRLAKATTPFEIDRCLAFLNDPRVTRAILDAIFAECLRRRVDPLVIIEERVNMAGLDELHRMTLSMSLTDQYRSREGRDARRISAEDLVQRPQSFMNTPDPALEVAARLATLANPAFNVVGNDLMHQFAAVLTPYAERFAAVLRLQSAQASPDDAAPTRT